MPWSNQGNGGGGPWGQGPTGGPQPPDLEGLLRKGQDRFRGLLPGGTGGWRGVAIIALIVIVIWMLTGIYRVGPEEEGVVLTFGAYTATTKPGLNYHWPWPIQSVEKPKVTRSRRVDVGFFSGGDTGRSTVSRDIPEESLMLTGDENIIDIDFQVLWKISDARTFLFNVQNVEATVKQAAESAMREVIGVTPIQSALSEGRQQVEQQTQFLLQQILDFYVAGVEIEEIKLQKVDPPSAVIDSFRDVQRARADLERLRNEAEGYENDIIPRARGEAERMIQEASGYREQVIAEAEGDADRFLSIYREYALAKNVTAQRIYLETMQEVLAGMNKVIIDNQGGPGVVPYLPLPELRKRAEASE